MAWELVEFAGLVPRLRSRQLPKGYAVVAHDVDLTHGTIKPFLEPKLLKTVLADQIRLYIWGCDFYTWDKCVDIAEWLPDCPRLFITGRMPYPETMTPDGTYRRLGVLPPPEPPMISGTPKNTEESRSVAYITTFVNSFGEESGPSMPSDDIAIEDGDPVTILFRYNPPLEYDIKKIRIYRRETGFRLGAEKEQDLKTHWFFLTELDVTERGFLDETPIINLGWAFEGLHTREPPAELSNIYAIPETAILTGSVANKLLFSRNLQPHNWEKSQEMTLDDNIIALGAIGNSLYVATDGHPYRVTADVGCNKRECRNVVRYKQSFPMINCHTGRGAVTTPFGFVYASVDGLVMLTDDMTAKVITSDVLSADDWRMLEPHTTRLAYHRGALFVVTNKISFMLWLDNVSYNDTKHKRMVTISDQPVDFMDSRQGELIMLSSDGKIEQWNAGNRLRPYRWVSGDVESGFVYDITRVRAKVLSKDTQISTVSDRASISRRFPSGDRIIPFNRHGKIKTFNIEVKGVGEVAELAVGVCESEMRG